MDVLAWVTSALLALLMLAAGGAKLGQPYEKLAQNPNWGYVEDLSPRLVKLIGTLEVLAAVGLILPPLLGVAEWLAVVAAVGVVALMIGAVATHLRRHEAKVLPVNVGIAVLAVFVIIGRLAG